MSGDYITSLGGLLACYAYQLTGPGLVLQVLFRIYRKPGGYWLPASPTPGPGDQDFPPLTIDMPNADQENLTFSHWSAPQEIVPEIMRNSSKAFH
jgi:hypothetical protein